MSGTGGIEVVPTEVLGTGLEYVPNLLPECSVGRVLRPYRTPREASAGYLSSNIPGIVLERTLQ